MNKRREAMLAKKKKEQLTKETPTVESKPSAPTMPFGAVSEEESKVMDAKVSLSRFSKEVDALGMSLPEFLREHSDVAVVKSQHEVKTPDGEVYTAVVVHYTYEQLVSMCVIDPDNVRGDEDRTEAALDDLLDEIGNGFQIIPLIAYRDENGKISIVDGSRRYSAALLKKVGLNIQVFDRKPTASAIVWIVAATDRKKTFGYFDTGKLMQKLMVQYKCEAKDLPKISKYSRQQVSRCLSFVESEPRLLNRLPTTDIAQADVDKFNALHTILVERDAIDSPLLDVGAEISSLDKANPKAHAKKLIGLWKRVADKLAKKPKVAAPLEAIPTLFESGQMKINAERKSTRRFDVSFQRVPKEAEDELFEAIKSVMEKYQ